MRTRARAMSIKVSNLSVPLAALYEAKPTAKAMEPQITYEQSRKYKSDPVLGQEWYKNTTYYVINPCELGLSPRKQHVDIRVGDSLEHLHGCALDRSCLVPRSEGSRPVWKNPHNNVLTVITMIMPHLDVYLAMAKLITHRHFLFTLSEHVLVAVGH